MSNPLQYDLADGLAKLLQARSKLGLFLVIFVSVVTTLVQFVDEVRSAVGYYTWSDQVVIGLVFVWFVSLAILVWYVMKLTDWTTVSLIGLLSKGYWAGVVVTYCLFAGALLFQTERFISPMLECNFPQGSENCTSVGIWMFIFAATAPLALVYTVFKKASNKALDKIRDIF